MNLAYFDCFSGISGDMTLGALLDLGVPMDWLQKKIESLPLNGFHLETRTVEKNGITAVDLTVHVDGSDRTHRHFTDIRQMIEGSTLSETVARQSLRIFEKIAAAEADIHGCSLDEVHFHEVGAVDAIVDIIGTVLGLAYLGIEKVISSRIPLGTGFVECCHGILPVPAPATLKILEGVPICGAPVEKETVTPTGAAIISALATDFGPFPEMVISRIGYGAGKHDLGERPNLLRIILGTSEDDKAMASTSVAIVESAIDDMNPEYFGFLMERLFELGALDVNWSPVYMKKNRPGTGIQVICRERDREEMIRAILSETTTTGVRYRNENRVVLERTIRHQETRLGNVRVKVFRDPYGGIRKTPEYEDCRRIARERKMPIRAVYEMLLLDFSGSDE